MRSVNKNLLLLFFCLLFNVVGQADDLDSLKRDLVRSTALDTNRVILFKKISKEFRSLNLDSAIYYGEQALELSSQISYQEGIYNSKFTMANSYKHHAKYQKAQKLYFELLEMATSNNDNERASWYLGNIATVEYFSGHIDKAIVYSKRALELAPLDSNIADAYFNIGSMYVANGKLDSSIIYIDSSETLYKQFDKLESLPNVYLNKGGVYEYMEDLPKALTYYNKALEAYEQLDLIEDMGYVYHNIGSVYRDMKDFPLALSYANRALVLSDSLNDIYLKQETFGILKEINQAKGDFEQAVIFGDSATALQEKIRDLESDKAIMELSTKYETEKKEKENLLLKNETQLQKVELDRKNIVQWTMILVLGLISVITVLIFVQFRNKKKANLELSEKNREIELQNEEITTQSELLQTQNHVLADQKKQITESINYAERIQRALLTTRLEMITSFPSHFILFRPKDIVSGDFYWALEKNGYLYATVADCTGHGVPGAFMSMLGVSYLNEIVKGQDLITPAEILDKLRAQVIRDLGQGDAGGSKDGMDMSLIRYHSETNELLFAGANNPLYLITEDSTKEELAGRTIEIEGKTKKLLEIKADKMPVGYRIRSEQSFTNVQINLKEGETVYLFSDGFPDQFGGEKGKKVGYKSFKKLLLNMESDALDKQHDQLNDFIEEWMTKGDEVQVDDVSVMGIRI